MTRNTPRHRRAAPVVAIAACATTVLLGRCCTAADRPAHRRAQHLAVAPPTASPSVHTTGRRRTVMTPQAPTTATATASRQRPAAAVIPAPSRATRTAIGSARAWAIAANSSTYRDSSPGQWTVRARPFVTGREARAEDGQRTGGGSTWVQIQNGRCATHLHQLVAFIPADAPSGPAVRIVYVSARVELTCVTGTDYLSSFAAQLTVRRVTGRWLVGLVRH